MKRQRKPICGRCRGDDIELPMNPIPCIHCNAPLCASCSIFHQPPLCLECVTRVIPWAAGLIVKSCSLYTPAHCEICLSFEFRKKGSFEKDCTKCKKLWGVYDTETVCVNHLYNNKGYKCCIPGCQKYICVRCIDPEKFPEPVCLICREDYTCELCNGLIPHLHPRKTIRRKRMDPIKVCFRCYNGPELFVKHAMLRLKLPKDMINLIFSFLFPTKRVTNLR